MVCHHIVDNVFYPYFLDRNVYLDFLDVRAYFHGFYIGYRSHSIFICFLCRNFFHDDCNQSFFFMVDSFFVNSLE